jgi:hypothetical protein
MNNELQNKLAEVLGGIADGVSQAKDFAVEQLPDVAQQYIMFGMLWETAAFVMLLLGSAGFAVIFKIGLNHMQKIEGRGYGDDTGPIMVMAGSGLMGFLMALFSLMQLKSVFLVWFSPKLYLLQGIAGLLK